MNGARPADSASPLAQVWRGLGLLFLEGLSVGLAGWAIRNWERLPDYVSSNQLPNNGRHYVILSMATGALVSLVVATVLVAFRRLVAVPVIERLSRRAAPLCLMGFFPFLFNWRCWSGRDLSFLMLAAFVGLGAQGLFRVSIQAGPVVPATVLARPRAWVRRRITALSYRRRLPLALVIVGGLAWATYFSVITIQNHYRLGTSSFDLGVENNLLWNALHGGPLFKTSPHADGPHGSHLGYHQTYITYVLLALYGLVPRPEAPLVIQALLLAATALPLYGLARRRLGPWTACFIAYAYFLYAPLHGATLYDFHYLPFAPLFLWTTLYLLERRRDRWAALAVLASLALREDISSLMVFISLFLILVDGRPLAGTIVAGVSAIYFVGLKMIIMPRFLGGHESYVNQYMDLVPSEGGGYGGVLKTVFGNPGYTMGTLLERDKLMYLLQIIAPFAFLPWRRPVGFLLCSLPGFLFTLLATRYPPLIQISFQYTTYWTTFLFLAVIVNLDWITRRELLGQMAPGSRRAWTWAMALSVLVTSYQHGVILQHNTARGGFGGFPVGITAEDRRRHDDLYALLAQVPPLAKISSSEQVVPHVSSRPDAYTLRMGVFDAEYLLARMPLWDAERGAVRGALESGSFGVVDMRGEFVLARRAYSTDRNAAALARM